MKKRELVRLREAIEEAAQLLAQTADGFALLTTAVRELAPALDLHTAQLRGAIEDARVLAELEGARELELRPTTQDLAAG